MIAALAALLLATAAPQLADYPTLLDKLKAGGTSIELGALLLVAAALRGYNGYDQLDIAAVGTATKANYRTKVRALFEAQLAHDYTDINAHVIDPVADDKTSDSGGAALHRRIGRGGIDSILISGDAASTKTAFHVIGVDQEYLIFAVKGLKSGNQWLVKHDGVFDVPDATDTAKGWPQTLEFAIDSFFGKVPF